MTKLILLLSFLFMMGGGCKPSNYVPTPLSWNTESPPPIPIPAPTPVPVPVEPPITSAIQIITPIQGTILTGFVHFIASVVPAAGKTTQQVDFLMDGIAFGGPDKVPPHDVSFDTATFQNGLHSLQARLIYTDGTTELSQAISLTIANGTVLQSAVLQWDTPIANADGTPLQDLAGFKIYHGMASGTYPDVQNAGNQSGYTWNGLLAGTHYFVVSAYDTSGNESTKSNEVLKVIP